MACAATQRYLLSGQDAELRLASSKAFLMSEGNWLCLQEHLCNCAAVINKVPRRKGKEKKKSFFFCFTKNRSVTGQLQVL